MKRYIYIIGIGLLLMSLTAKAQQRFFNLTAEQVRIDSLLPVFTHHVPLGPDYADSVYTVSIVYPEFIPMSDADIARYARITSDPLPAMPKVSRVISVDRKCGELTLSFVPLVFRDGQYQKLVSFMLEVRGERLEVRSKRSAVNGKRAATQRYADHSVLATGKWTKIRVPSTGIYQINSELIKKAGFSDINKVKVYGYGGGMQPEILTADYLAETDDLMEVTTCETGGRKLFYAIGPVTWDANNKRIRNPYSSYGYYFLTENDSTAQTMSEAEFIEKYYPLADDYNSLYEVDDFAWYHGGRNLYDATAIAAGGSHTFTVPAKGAGQEGVMTAIVTADDATTVYVSVNDVTVDTLRVLAHGGYEQMRQAESVKKLHNLQASNKVTLQTLAGGGTTRLDYISIHVNEPAAAPDLSATFPTPEYVYGITNQDHHADPFADMVIIIPTTQKLKAQAERLKTMHEQKDGLRVTIVPADELFNEFSSGTPDANAYRRYLKMLYDRAGTDVDMPRYLLLLGDGAWDNRMLSVEWKDYSPDDFLLCYESENSSSATDCYVTDDYFCLMDDDEGGNMLIAKADVAVGRISARTADDAGIAVDKIESYVNNENAGAWQNLLCFMGDDGNENAHMQDADSVAREVERLYPTYQIKRVMWDAYTRVSSSTGNSYPDVTRLIKQQMQQGALIMNYSGHGRADAISHEYVLRLADFENVSSRLPLWLTASCDIMPFDGQEENIGETAFFNKKGGAVAFYGTTRTVYQTQNRLMNLAFTRHVLSQNDSGQLLPIGEAVRRAKNELIETGIITGYANGQPIYSSDRTQNKLQYTLLGDPAMRLAAPTMGIRIDSINGTPLVDGQTQKLEAGSTATLSGHVLERDGQLSADYNGTLTVTVCDALEKIVCKMNDPTETSEPFVYYDRPNTLFSGSNVVKNGRFTLTFAVPKDISYSDANGLINLYAVNDDKTKEASGICGDVLMSGSGGLPQGGAGPNIYCFLNSEAFVNGGSVNPTPYFVAQLNDEDGINAAGSGIGHDLQLIIDGEMTKTYSLNDYFQYDFGSYTSGTIGFSIPALSYGEHKLLFRAWDVLNNSSTAELTFNVVKGLEPLFFDVEATKNPATTATSFRILHDRTCSDIDVVLDVFDFSGRHLWSHTENGVPLDNSYAIDWDLTVDGGRRLQTGVYLYRIRIASDGSTYASKAKKLIILTHK
ncbi:MAG: type IX secretion system sortase PorU [Prevotella sp.]|nr:type IX secretion system sortase PorU [Prevotella sp.]